MRRPTRPIPARDASSRSEGPAREAEAYFDASLDRLVRAARAESCPVDSDAAWQRVVTGLAAREPGRRYGPAPLARAVFPVAAVACLLVLLEWQGARGRGTTGSETAPVRLAPAIWQEDVIAADPLDGATDALINTVWEATS
jgi:hypothetical protein